MDRVKEIEQQLRKLSDSHRKAEQQGMLADVAAIEEAIDTKLDELNAAKAGLK